MRSTPMPAVAALAALAGAAAAAPPAAPRRPVTDVYWGVEVVDDYRYMEDVEDPEVAAWVAALNEHTRRVLDAQPQRAAILERVVELTHDASPDYFNLEWAAGRLFAIKRQPPKEQAFLVVFPPGSSLTGERVLVDPNELDPGGHTSIDFYVPSLDGALVAVSMSERGTEDGTLHLFEVATGRKLADTIPRVNGGTAGGDVAWSPGGRGLFYTRYPYPGERPEADLPFYQQVWHHRLGRPLAEDRYVIGRGFPRIGEIELETSDDGRFLLVTVSDGDGGEYAYWLKGPGFDWTEIAGFEDGVVRARIGPDDALYLLSRAGAPHKKILRLPCRTPDLDEAELVVPESDAVIRDFLPANASLYVVEMLGGPTRLRILDLAGGASRIIDDPEPSTISGLVGLDDGGILLRRQSYLTPPAWLRLRPGAARCEPTPLVHESPADFSDCVVKREFAVADDGARIPVTLVMRRGTKRDGSSPLLLYGYGSYGFTLSPYFSAHRRVWIEQGGVYAVANIRGGGAYGDEWHRVANLENKKVTIDDFAACARHVVDRGWTTVERLAIQGGSAGGLMVLGVMTHHPEVCAAVVAHVGISDVLRTEVTPNGAFNVTEFGTVKHEKQFRGMYAYSPLHNVEDGVTYPALLATTGMNDPRVEPWQSFKMVARLQAAGTPNPVLLRVSYETGHGGGTKLSARDQELADVYTFLAMTVGGDETTQR